MSDNHGVAGSPYSVSPLSVAEAYVSGRDASAVEAELIQCPYPAGSPEHGAWHRGFALRAILSGLGAQP